MVTKVISVSASITFYFINGEQYTLPVITGLTDSSNYCTSIDTDEKLCTQNNNNIVGAVTGNSLSLKLVSSDKLLVPNNTQSAYYGYMNKTAKLSLTYIVHYPDDTHDESVNMGLWYVSSWESGTSSSKPEEIQILAVNLLSKVKNLPLSKMKLKKYIDINDFLKSCIDEINNNTIGLDSITYTSDSIALFRNSSYTWQLVWNNIERDTFEGLLNDIAKSTCSYLWIDRNNCFQTDFLLDDSVDESVGTLSGSTNLLSYDVRTGSFNQYSGVRVAYIKNIKVATQEVLVLKNPVVFSGENVLDDIKMNSSNIQNIRSIQSNQDDICSVNTWYKDSLSLNINVVYENPDVQRNIIVRGDVVTENYAYCEKYKSTNRESILEIKNRLLREEFINSYTQGLINIMTMQNNVVQCSGFINPKLKLGDTVRFQGSRLGIDDYYKVLGIKTSLSGGSYRATVLLQKFIGTGLNVIDIMNECSNALRNCLSGIYVDPNSVNTSMTVEEAALVEEDMGDVLAALKLRLQGGV